MSSKVVGYVIGQVLGLASLGGAYQGYQAYQDSQENKRIAIETANFVPPYNPAFDENQLLKVSQGEAAVEVKLFVETKFSKNCDGIDPNANYSDNIIFTVSSGGVISYKTQKADLSGYCVPKHDKFECTAKNKFRSINAEFDLVLDIDGTLYGFFRSKSYGVICHFSVAGKHPFDFHY